jgi:hypothetical protein
MSEHKDLTGTDLHECKGAATAAANTLLQANGTGGATFVDVLSTLKTRNKIAVTTRIPDISTASSVFVASPMAGVIETVYVTLHGAITTADSVVTAEINGAALTGLSITAAFSGSTGGSTFSGSPSGGNSVAAGQAIEIITDGGSSTAVAADVTIVINTA